MKLLKTDLNEKSHILQTKFYFKLILKRSLNQKLIQYSLGSSQCSLLHLCKRQGMELRCLKREQKLKID